VQQTGRVREKSSKLASCRSIVTRWVRYVVVDERAANEVVGGSSKLHVQGWPNLVRVLRAF
jgi:hypothetical protein